MIMDSRSRPYNDSENGFRFNHVSIPNKNILNSNCLFGLPNFMDQNQNQNSTSVVPLLCSSVEEACAEEDCDFSDIVLQYINQILMGEDMEEKSCMFLESSELQAAENPFYEILGQKYPHSPDQQPLDQNIDNFNSSSGISYIADGLIDTPSATVDHVPDLYAKHESAWHFRKGLEEAQKFLPNGNGLFPKEPNSEYNGVVVEQEEKNECSPNESRGRKNLHREDIDSEQERSSKHSAPFADDTIKSEMYDEVLLSNLDKISNDIFGSTLLQTLKIEFKNEASKNGQSKASNGGKTRGKKQGGKKDVVDLRTLLIQCAQAVAANDCRSAEELLKQIRKHSSPFGDGYRRLAHYFANGLEARMAGTGSEILSALCSQRASAADVLKAYKLYFDACPFKKISMFFSNKTIYEIAENTTRLHIVDFGIVFGFQWPSFIQRLSRRTTPIRLRITGIDLPQPGFKPAERIEETGQRLANYAERFNVPFEYHAIAKKWEAIQLEDLKIDPDETIAVNCMYHFKNQFDETVVFDSPRNAVLKLIRRMNPAVFVQGIVNGGYGSPFFITRFREALFHFSSVFDMLETTVSREHPQRLLLEQNLFGREALNVIACEGTERIDRPETYKQWLARNMRAGFQQLPLQPECMKKARDLVKSSYHKDYVIDQDSQWILQGWKGRIIYGISAWKPVYNL